MEYNSFLFESLLFCGFWVGFLGFSCARSCCILYVYLGASYAFYKISFTYKKKKKKKKIL
jgi:hypothetical protein